MKSKIFQRENGNISQKIITKRVNDSPAAILTEIIIDLAFDGSISYGQMREKYGDRIDELRENGKFYTSYPTAEVK